MMEKRFRIIISILTFCWLSSASMAQSEVQREYKRDFLISGISINQEEIELLTLDFEKTEYLKIEKYCTKNDLIVVSAKADYPKRINAIKSQIDAIFITHGLKTKIVLSETPVDLNNICK